MTSSEPTLHRVSYVHAVLEGSAREAGRIQALHLARNPEAVAFFTSPFPAKGALTPQQAEHALTFFERHCPGLNEEVEGFAQGLNVTPEQVVYYALTLDPPPFKVSGQCSHAVVMPSRTHDGHLRVIRSYEFSHRMSDLRLATMRIQGRPAHIGFTELCFGREDGMNEHGLCITMSAGAPMAPFEPGGCMFWALVRTVLDRCATVDEALEVIAGIPLSFNLNLLLADRSGQAALVEMASSHRALRRIAEGEPFLISTNHFTQPDMRSRDTARMWNSVQRYQSLCRRLGHSGVTRDALAGILSSPVIPDGLCAHDFTGFFGTLWSEIFDVTAGTVEVCFGPPSHNPWFTFDLQTPAGLTEYPAVLPDTPVDDRFWQKLAPGMEV